MIKPHPTQPVLRVDKNTITSLTWGDDCQYWTLIDKENMGIFYEKMPPNTSDKLHMHPLSEQFLYVLKGKLGIVIESHTYYLSPGQGILIAKETPHQVFNDSALESEFILFASPNHPDDRVEI